MIRLSHTVYNTEVLILEAIFDSCRLEADETFHCYHALLEQTTLSSAAASCPTGSHLAIIESQEELQFVSSNYLEG